MITVTGVVLGLNEICLVIISNNKNNTLLSCAIIILSRDLHNDFVVISI